MTQLNNCLATCENKYWTGKYQNTKCKRATRYVAEQMLQQRPWVQKLHVLLRRHPGNKSTGETGRQIAASISSAPRSTAEACCACFKAHTGNTVLFSQWSATFTSTCRCFQNSNQRYNALFSVSLVVQTNLPVHQDDAHRMPAANYRNAWRVSQATESTLMFESSPQ